MRELRLLGGLLLFSLAFPGCTQSAVQPVLASDVVAPDSFVDESSRTWQRLSEIGKDDDAIFARFLSRNVEYGASPSMAGSPTLFSNGKDRRFYWLNGAGASATWTCLQFERGQFKVVEGSGNPYAATP